MQETKRSEKPQELAQAIELPAACALIGHIKKLTNAGQPIVNYCYRGNHFELPAQFTCASSQLAENSKVFLLFICNDINQPIISGILGDENNSVALEEAIQQTESSISAAPEVHTENSMLAKNHLTIENENGITLRSGESSLTLTPDGHVIINGRYISSDASKVNRIIGGTVKVN